MENIKTKELVFGTFVDMNSKKASSLNGSEVCFVLAVENFDKFIKSSCEKNYKDIAVLMRYEVSENFANEYIEEIQAYRAPHNSKWYYRKQLQESMNSMSKANSFAPKLYKSKKDSKYKHFEGAKIKKQTNQ